MIESVVNVIFILWYADDSQLYVNLLLCYLTVIKVIVIFNNDFVRLYFCVFFLSNLDLTKPKA